MQRSKRRKLAKLNGRVPNKANAVRVSEYWVTNKFEDGKVVKTYQKIRRALGPLFQKKQSLMDAMKAKIEELTNEKEMDSNIPIERPSDNERI